MSKLMHRNALWCPMNDKIQHIVDKLNIKVYKEENETTK